MSTERTEHDAARADPPKKPSTFRTEIRILSVPDLHYDECMFGRMILAIFCMVLLVGRTFAGDVDFRNDLIPVLTKYGCNAGACHGAALGRGGLKLSLYGSNPKLDYDAITRQLQGRRVNRSDPARSLVLLKPTQNIEHGGGLVFDEDSAAAQLVLRWIQQGANDLSSRRLERVDVSPEKSVMESTGDRVQLTSVAYYSDGTKRDVTSWTIFDPEDDGSVEIEDKNIAIAKRRGRHIIVARYLEQVIPIELIVPLTDAAVNLESEPRQNLIDEHVLQSLSTLRIPVSPLVDDATFLRRLTLDLTGRLPSKQQVSRFEEDAVDSRTKQAAERLLDSPEFVEYWTLKVARWLRMKNPSKVRGAHDEGELIAYHSWLRRQLSERVGYDEIARKLVVANGDTTQLGPPNFYRTVAGAREQAEFFSELFMGSRLRCANCHNHPLDRWTQDDYHGLAAIFAKVETGRIVKPKPRGEVIHPRTLEPAQPSIPGEPILAGDVDSRSALADWLTDPDNPYFAKAIVNRLWKSMMGRGLVESVDDFRATNPATHPKLLDELASDFVKNGYDLRRTLRLIATSATYARSPNATARNQEDDRFYSHALRRPLEAEVLADAITDVLGVAEQYGSQPVGTRAIALVNPQTPSKSLEILGRCDRRDSCESATPSVGGLPQKLHLFNGELLNARIGSIGGRLDQAITAKRKPIEIISEFYQVALSRLPTDAERQFWSRELNATHSANETRELLEDFVWSLLTTREFSTNH